MVSRQIRPFLVFMLSGLAISCSDSGSEPAPAPTITAVNPASGTSGDTVRITGTAFGTASSSGTVSFGGVAAIVYVSWSDREIDVVIPPGALTGSVIVTVSGRASNGVPFTIAGGSGGISFAAQVQPILSTGCALSGCHAPPSPSSGFDQSAYSTLRLGGSKFGAAVIVPGDSANSMIVRAMRGTAPGLGRMPFGGPWVSSGVPDSLIVTIGTWIQQGAGNN